VLVADTSVLIDLERSELLRSAFRLEMEFVVPDLLYEHELKGNGGEALLALGLRVERLDSDAVGKAQDYMRGEKRLSTPDAFALSLAQRNQWTLLSGDGAVRELAEKEQLSCHGVLWLIDRLEEQGAVRLVDLHAGLGRLAQHPRCRLPRLEIEVRLARYMGAPVQAKI
jgi:hypothetical protein